jgi:hypothetical protein
MMIRNLFVREEEGTLVLGAGLLPRWLEQREPLSFGTTLTPFGPVTISVEPAAADRFRFTLEAGWRGQPPKLEVRAPGYHRVNQTEFGHEFMIEADA